MFSAVLWGLLSGSPASSHYCRDEDGGMDGYWLNMSTLTSFAIHLAQRTEYTKILSLLTKPYVLLDAFFSALRTWITLLHRPTCSLRGPSITPAMSRQLHCRSGGLSSLRLLSKVWSHAWYSRASPSLPITWLLMLGHGCSCFHFSFAVAGRRERIHLTACTDLVLLCFFLCASGVFTSLSWPCLEKKGTFCANSVFLWSTSFIKQHKSWRPRPQRIHSCKFLTPVSFSELVCLRFLSVFSVKIILVNPLNLNVHLQMLWEGLGCGEYLHPICPYNARR